MDIDEVKKELGDCDWMRAVLNDYTVNAVLWLINRVETFEGQMCPKCGELHPVLHCEHCGHNWEED